MVDEIFFLQAKYFTGENILIYGIHDIHPACFQSVDEHSLSASDTSSSVESGPRVLSQQPSVESMSLGVDEGAPGDTSRDSGINEPITPTGDVPAPINNSLQKDTINSRTKVRQSDH